MSLGQLAVERSTDTAVKQFGQRMVADHGKADKQLKGIASEKGATLPTELTTKQTHEVERLSKLSGREFDKSYMSLMVKDHKTDLKEFQRAAEKSDDPDLKSFAASTAVVIQQHLGLAERIDESLKTTVSQNN